MILCCPSRYWYANHCRLWEHDFRSLAFTSWKGSVRDQMLNVDFFIEMWTPFILTTFKLRIFQSEIERANFQFEFQSTWVHTQTLTINLRWNYILFLLQEREQQIWRLTHLLFRLVCRHSLSEKEQDEILCTSYRTIRCVITIIFHADTKDLLSSTLRKVSRRNRRYLWERLALHFYGGTTQRVQESLG